MMMPERQSAGGRKHHGTVRGTHRSNRIRQTPLNFKSLHAPFQPTRHGIELPGSRILAAIIVLGFSQPSLSFSPPFLSAAQNLDHHKHTFPSRASAAPPRAWNNAFPPSLSDGTPRSRVRCRALDDSVAQGSSIEETEKILEELFGTERNPTFWSCLQACNAKSGTDIACAGASSGDLTYGEFDLHFFTKLLALAEPKEGDVFCDIGSGCGRLVIAAALSYPHTLRTARGVEVLAPLHQAAEAALGALREREEESERGSEREGAATQGGREGRKKGVLGGCGVEVRQADVLEERALLSDVDIAFCYSTAFAASGPYLTDLSMLFGLSLRPGARIVTVDKMLLSDGPWEYELLHTVQVRPLNPEIKYKKPRSWYQVY